MQFTLKQIETFVWVATLGSFRKAAERLNTTQPNVSSRIAAFELALGARLLHRDAGSVRLTAKGRDILKDGQQILRAAEQLLDTAQTATLQSGVLKLGVTEMVVHSWLRSFMTEFHRLYPNILVELSVDISVTLQGKLANRSIDLAFLNSPGSADGMASLPLENAPMVWVIAPGQGFDAGQKITNKDVTRFPIMTSARNTRPFDECTAYFRKIPQLAARIVPSGNLAAALQMTIDGLGIATLPAPMIRDALAAGDIIEVHPTWAPSDLPFYACYDKAWHSSVLERAAALAKICAKEDIHKENLS